MIIKETKLISLGKPLVFCIKEGEKIASHPFFKALQKEDQVFLGRTLSRLPLTAGSFRVFVTPGNVTVVFCGLPKRGDFTSRKAIVEIRRVLQGMKKEKFLSYQIQLRDFVAKGLTTPKEIAEHIATQSELANFEFVTYKTPPAGENWKSVEEILVYSESGTIQKFLDRGKIVGEEINEARKLANTPGGDMTPAMLALAAVKTGEKYGIKVNVLEDGEIKKLGMGGIIGVSQGSSERPRFIVMEYMKGKKSEKPVVLVGKGITFDTGGLNLKPTNSIYEMHMDMSGGASVIHTIAVAARLKLKKNIVALIPAAENMVSGSSYRPGDILKTMSGKTIEVTNTDAEGRVVLADALTYAKRYEPRLLVDVATLTGAAVVALGERASAIFTTSEKLERLFREKGEASGDYVWPLPLWDEYENDIKGTFGDVVNSGKSRYGGAIEGAMFLWQFVKPEAGKTQTPWVHVDIAPRMTALEGECLAKGALGAGVGLLVKVLEKI